MATKEKTLNDAFHETLKDVYYAEKHGVRALGKAAKAAKAGELKQVLEELPSIDPALLSAYISHTYPFDRFEEAFAVAQRADSAKVMIEFA